MTTSWRNGQTIAHRLRVRCSGLDPLATRQRIESLLNTADLHPPGLAPSAILCIRTLRDPLPGSLQLRQGSGGMRPPRAWEQAVIASLDQSVRQAARPALGAVPANAEAVIFTDRAELLACLASDWCEGSVTTNWWWQSLFKGVDIARTVLPTWIDAPEYIPAALHHLAMGGKVVPFARSLTLNDTRTLLQSIIRSFALHDLRGSPLVAAQSLSHNTTEHHLNGGAPLAAAQSLDHIMTEHHPKRGASLVSARLTPPWQPWVPESGTSGLTLEQQCLLGIGLMLHRAPTVVRTTSFAHTTIQWYLAAQLPTTSRQALSDQSKVLTGEQDTRKGLPYGHDLHLSDQERTDREQSSRDNLHLSDQEHPHSSQVVQGDHERARKEHPRSSQTVREVHEGAYQERLYEAQIETVFGGIFYLINLGLFLNLYGDFTTPLQPGIPLPLWDFVALLGRQLLGEKIQADPVWGLLAQLAGRSEQEAPGKHFKPPESWHLPVEWLAPFAQEGVWQWSAGGGRLRVGHPEQFLVLDLPLDKGNPVQQLRQETQAYGDVQLRRRGPQRSGAERFSNLRAPTSRHGKMRPQIKRWLGWLMPYVQARLKRALALSDVDELPYVLCEHSARILVTATHLDIILSLDELPVEIRIAGLDRDPGWVPAAGRFIAFHFEVSGRNESILPY